MPARKYRLRKSDRDIIIVLLSAINAERLETVLQKKFKKQHPETSRFIKQARRVISELEWDD